MSNKVRIEPTIFQNRRTSEYTYGVRVYDDYEQFYDNTWEQIPDDDLECLEQLIESESKEIKSLLAYIKEEKEGVYIGGEWYSWDQIKHCF